MKLKHIMFVNNVNFYTLFYSYDILLENINAKYVRCDDLNLEIVKL